MMYHSTNPKNVPKILKQGLRSDQGTGYTMAGSWADEYYGTRPIYVSLKKGDYAGQSLAVDIEGLDLVADLPGLVDAGANVEEDGVWWSAGDEPPELAEFLDDNGMIYYSDLITPDNPAIEAAIKLTGTAAILGNIPPNKIKLTEQKVMKITRTQLKKIINEEYTRVLSEIHHGRVHLEELTVGKNYEVGYRNVRWTSTFLGWSVDESGPRMRWQDLDDGTEWESYMMDSVMSVGSSGDALIVFNELA